METTDLREAKERDAQLETAMSLLGEAERLVNEGKVRLPKGVSFDGLEQTLEDMFIGFAENREGLKRAIKGEAYTDQPPEAAKPTKPSGRKKQAVE